MKNLLIIDTSSSACSIALALGDEIFSHHEVAPMQQAQTILPLIDELLRQANISLSDIDVIAFGRGPGSFTGIRIAVSVAQGLAYALNVPLISISSLAAIAQASFHNKGWKKSLVAIDARLNEIYWGAYEVNENGIAELKGTESVTPPEVFKPSSENSDWYGVGNAWFIYRDKISVQVIDVDSNQLPDARAMIPLAKVKLAQGELLTPEKSLPVYLRDEVAVKSNKS